MANDAVAGNVTRVAPAGPGDGDDPVRAVLAAYTHDLVTAVDETLDTFLTAEVDALNEIDASMGRFAATAREAVLAGGKRIRSTFAYWGWRGAVGGTEALPPVLPALAALELLHTFALVHDDVMDASTTRRGRPTAHVALAEQHVAAGHRGDPGRFGEAVAVLIGDLCMVWADQLLAHATVPSARLFEVRRCYDQMRVETVAGQYLDVLGENDPASWSVDRALRVARYKTASYTVQRPLLFGACLAGVPADDAAGLRVHPLRPGRRRGVPAPRRPARRLRRSRRRPASRPATTSAPASRPRCSCWPASWPRRPSSRALERAADGPVDRLAELVAETGAVARVERMIAERVSDALAALDAAPVDQTARTALTGLATAAASRRA